MRCRRTFENKSGPPDAALFAPQLLLDVAIYNLSKVVLGPNDRVPLLQNIELNKPEAASSAFLKRRVPVFVDGPFGERYGVHVAFSV